MNNEVHEHGRLVGFRCWNCGNVFDRMWGEKCNHCRSVEQRHRESMTALANLARTQGDI